MAFFRKSFKDTQMKSKRSNSTIGRGTPGSRAHGLTMSEEQNRDKERLKKRNGKIKGTKITKVRVLVGYEESDSDSYGVLEPGEKDLASFPSEFSTLRRDKDDNLGYRIPRLIPGSNGEVVQMPEHRGKNGDRKPRSAKKSKYRKMPPAYRVLVAGQPDIDAGVDGWIQPQDTRDFVRRGNRMDKLLETFDRITFKKNYLRDSDGDFELDARGRRILVSTTPYVKPFRAESSVLKTEVNSKGERITSRVKTDATTLGYRNTIGVSPGLSRALQRLVEDGYMAETRRAIETTVEPFGRFYEATYRGPNTNVKVTSIVPHLDSGHFHYDTWNHSTFLDTSETGVDREKVPIRRWDSKASCHYGPGPGVTFWMRHFVALGDLEELAKTEPEAAKRAGYTRMLCDQAISGCKARAEEGYDKAMKESLACSDNGRPFTGWIRPADDYARDIRVSEEADRLLAKAIRDLGLEKDYVAMGMAEYKDHLIEAYTLGETGIRMDTVEDLREVEKVVERARERTQKDIGENERIMRAAKLDKEAALKVQEENRLASDQLRIDQMEMKTALEAARNAKLSTQAVFAQAELTAASVMEKAKLDGMLYTLKRLSSGKETRAESIEEAEEQLDSRIIEIQKEAEIGAWKKVLLFFEKDVVSPTESLKSLRKSVARAINRRISTGVTTGLTSLFRMFGREVPEARAGDEVERAIKDACEVFKSDARRDGLSLAVAHIRGVDISELTEKDEAVLQKEIEVQGKAFREGVAKQEKATVRLFANKVFGVNLTNFIAVKAMSPVEDLISALGMEFKRRGDAEAKLKQALPTLNEHEPELALEAKAILDLKPKMPADETTKKKEANGKDGNQEEKEVEI